jgi:hypothetical protein
MPSPNIYGAVIDLTHNLNDHSPNWEGTAQSPFQAKELGNIDRDGYYSRVFTTQEHYGTSMVKELDLFESNLVAGGTGRTSETHVTQRYTVQNWRVTSSQSRSERVGPSPMVSARSSILTAAIWSTRSQRYTRCKRTLAMWSMQDLESMIPDRHV